jgi:hypothetical protein
MKPVPDLYPRKKSIRVITDTDANCECDDQFAIAHALMTPEFEMRAFIAEHYGGESEDDTEQKSYDELQNVIGLMRLKDSVNILHGAKRALPAEDTPSESEGARFIVEEAMRDDPRPLFVVNQAAHTSLASAYLMEPRIAERITAISIIGGEYPTGSNEFNLLNDLHAANVLFKSDMELWQVPMNVYTTMRVSFFELMTKIYPYGDIGRYLADNTFERSATIGDGIREIVTAFAPENAKPSHGAVQTGPPGNGMWSLGDSPVVGLMLNNALGAYDIIGAPQFNPDGTYLLNPDNPRKIRVYRDIDSKYILSDMFAKFKFFFG